MIPRHKPRPPSSARSAGWSTIAAMLAVLALAVLAGIGLDARTRDLEFEQRTLCRVRARWAAESAIARGRAIVVSGVLPGRFDRPLVDGVQYALRAERRGSTVALEGRGTCTNRGRAVQVQIDALLTASGRTVLTWLEATPSTP